MRTHLAKSKRLPIVMIIFSVFACLPLLLNAHTAATSVTIANNSSRAIRHVYLSAATGDNWGADQLSSAIPAGGGSFTLSDLSCSGTGVKVIAEDQNGCFLYQVVACNQSMTWTVTDDAVPDCGN
jgi:hypothetical protein